MIYFDNAATTICKPQEVIDAVCAAMNSLGNSGRGAHAASLDASREIYGTRAALARLFGAEDPRRIAFASNSTEALNTALKGVLRPGDHAITTVLEHNSVLRPLYELESEGVELTFVGCDEKGRPDYDGFAAAIRPNTRMIVCTHGSNLTGNLVDIARIGRLAGERGILFLVDASQTAGVFPIDVQNMGIDILCFTGHKSLLGPQGTGGLYVREGIVVRPLKSGGSGVMTYRKSHPQEMPTALEAGTQNGHGIVGLGAAVNYILNTGMDTIRKREQMLARRFYEGVRDIPGMKFYGDLDARERCPIVTLNLGEYDSSQVADELFVTYGISTRPGAHCAPLMHQALGTVEQGAVRFSFSHYNTEAEVDAAIAALRELAEDPE